MSGLGLTFYVRRRLGAARWKRAHRFMPVFWALGVLHGILTGTDASRPWALALILPPVLAATAVLATRHYEAAPAAR
jgi:sulfoxide reductase heme-binding subunit YedZ